MPAPYPDDPVGRRCDRQGRHHHGWLAGYWRRAGRRVPGAGLGGGGQRLHDQPARRPGCTHRARGHRRAPTSDRILDAALERFGRIDTLVNSAGTFISTPFTEYTAANYATAVGATLTGFFWLTQRAIAEMARRYGGHVVNVSPIPAGAADSGTPAVLAALTEGGPVAATTSLAVEYAPYGIRVNAVSPGVIQTPLRPAESCEGAGGRRLPLGRPGQISDVVDAVLFLESSPFITGEILHIDGVQITGYRSRG
jgi:NAD(P)-dependent dehydrogenase (short-subunit alcohol dehydrogenase family)